MRNICGVSRYSLAAALIFIPGISAAQSTLATSTPPPATGVEPEAGQASGDIVVTAQRRRESIDRVPMSVQAFSGDTLKAVGITDASGIAQLTPGLNFTRSSANTPIYTLRGVGFNTPNLSATSPVGIYVDEVAYAYPYMSNGPSFDIERVEILKGPQGTLYGRNTTGGLINFIPARPGDHLEAGITGEFGNYKTYNFEGYISAPLSDTLGVRLAARSENSDKGWQQSVTRPGDRLGKKDRLGLRGTVIWEPTPTLGFDLRASYWRDKSDTVATQAVRLTPEQPPFVDPNLAAGVRNDWTSTTADWDPAGIEPPFRTNSEFYSIAGRATWKFSDQASLISLTAYNHIRRRDNNDVDGTAVAVFGQDSLGSIGSFSQELRIQGETARINYVVGGYYSHDSIVDNQIGYYDKTSTAQLLRFLAQNIIDPTNARYTPAQYASGFRQFRNLTTQTSETASVFANGSYDVTDKFKLSAGIRYTDDRLASRACSADFNGVTLPIWNTTVNFLVNATTGITPNVIVQPNGCMTYSADFKRIADPDKPTLRETNVAWRASAQYSIDSSNLLYATVSRGYKSGAVPQLPANNETQLEPARQEEVTAFEAGAKLGTRDRMLRFNAAGFYYNYRDKQLFSDVKDLVFTTLTRIVNVPKSELYGFEFNTTIQPTRTVSANVGVSYVHTSIKQFTGFTSSGDPFDFKGQRFPYTPEWQISGLINHDQPISERLGIQTVLNANYQSATSGSLANLDGFQVKSYTIVNGELTLHDTAESWRISLYARNMFDTYYWTAVDTLTDTVFRVPGQPRTFGIKLSYKY